MAHFQESSARLYRNELHKVQEDLNTNKESKRKNMYKKYQVYEDYIKALSYYKQSQDIWHTQRKIKQKEQKIHKYQKTEQHLMRIEDLKEQLAKAQEALLQKEEFINNVLSKTNASSIDDLFLRLQKIRESTYGLKYSQTDLQNILQQKAESIHVLSKELDNLVLSNQVNHNNELKSLSEIEHTLRLQKNSNKNLQSSIHFADKNSAAVILNMNKIAQKIEGHHNFKQVDDVVLFIVNKVKELLIN